MVARSIHPLGFVKPDPLSRIVDDLDYALMLLFGHLVNAGAPRDFWRAVGARLGCFDLECFTHAHHSAAHHSANRNRRQ